ncbi:DUF6446 family protein [Palleronia pelagia]|uniref:Histidine kinase n=1 Tax=Palleronia pelagia TaxID=387096 RepID=A0A1H8KQW6_9RHOB|nr:DUF6446 family protein [Palleronia pelagia]SEN95289.1 hypothetical protein SAMN04488011_10894 [Palleronia pelagia]
MIGKILTVAIVLTGIVVAASVYYLQVYHFYDEVDLPASQIALVPRGGDSAEPIPADGIQAIDANSSPIRFRACFDTTLSVDEARARFERVDAPPLNAPGWFDCFDADAIGAALADGQGDTFLAQKNIAYGADRVVAILPDGRGFVWHQLNNCGEKAYDGTVIGEECPPLEQFQ